MQLKISGLIEESIVDGRGIRYVVFTQGCPHHCKGCHNPETHDPSGGRIETTERIFQEFSENPILKGITFSGGEPFQQPLPLAELAEKVHEAGKDVTCYTGYTFEELIRENDPDRMKLLRNCDVLIDGKFVEERKNLELLFRGSENQRILDVPKSLSTGHAVIIPDMDD